MHARDVAIVGGGPAGLYTGWKLARAGYDVTLFEEHEAIGSPVHCTGVFAKDAFDEFGLGTESILNELKTVRFFAPSGESIDYTTRTVEAVVIDRLVFDSALAVQATRAGMRVVQARVTAVAVDRSGVTLKAGATTLRARVCVLACGASYVIQRKLGLGMPKLIMRSAQMEVPAGRLGDVEVMFGRRLAPGGFAWAVPVVRGDRAFVRIGVMCSGDAGGHFARVVEQVAPRWGVRPESGHRPRQKILPLEPLARTASNRLLAVGDAAGIVKPTTGGGIYYSLISASVAADTLREALARDELTGEALATYDAGWRQRLGAELQSQLVLRRIAHKLTDEDIDGLFDLARTDGIMPLMRRTAAFNHHREFIVALLKHPPARRLLFKAVLG